MGRKLLFVILVLGLLYVPSHAEDRTIVLSSLEWPPYTGQYLPGNGASAEVVRAAFKAVGYELEILFYPWQRTLDEASNNPEVMGYFPEYFAKNRAQSFLFSDSIGKSPLGVAKLKARTIHWNELQDLSQHHVGIVSGYVNTEEFDQLVETGVLWVEKTTSDILNLRKILAGRMDLAVIDTHVYAYLRDTDPLLSRRKGELSIDSKLLAIHDLFVCFRSGDQGERVRELFNEGLRRIRPQRIVREYIEAIGRIHQ